MSEAGERARPAAREAASKQIADAEAVASELARYAEWFERAPIGGFTLDRAGRIRLANLAGAALLGGERAALRGSAFADRVEALDRPAWQGFLQRVFADGRRQVCELTLAAPQQLRIVRLEGEARPAADECQLLVSDITEHRLASDALRRSETRLRAAYRRLAEAQEIERLRLTEQLHDEVGRNLTALGLNLSILQRDLAAEAAAPVQARLQDSIALLKTTVGQVRGLMSELYPPMLGDFGLFAALRWWVGETAGRSAVEIRLLPTEFPRRLAAEVESGLFRIAQEALANAVRHADARRIEIGLDDDGRRLALWIDDDGRGFDLAAVSGDDERPSWGLVWMRERALAIGATLQIGPRAGGGTRVRVERGRDAL